MWEITKPLLAGALALLIAAGPAACGDDDADAPPAGTAGTTTERTAPATTPEDFRTPGGDNSIQSYGDEADEKERAAASATVLGFLRARENGDWAGVCSYLAVATLKPLDQFAERAPQFKGKDCAELLEALTASVPPSARVSTIGGGIDSFRFQGDRGFALYHGTDGKDYFIPLVKEGGEWKIGGLAPSEFPG